MTSPLRSAAKWVRTVPLDCPHVEARELYVCYECAAANLDAYAAEQVAQARAEEREACAEIAKICQMPASPDMSPLTHQGIKLARREIAAALRAQK